jgi:hypothetical protein
VTTVIEAKNKPIGASLRQSARPADVTGAAYDDAVRELAKYVYSRTTLNRCGGLPAPPYQKPTRARRMVDLVTRITGGHE